MAYPVQLSVHRPSSLPHSLLTAQLRSGEMARLLPLSFSPSFSSAPAVGSITVVALPSPSPVPVSAAGNPFSRLGNKVCFLQCGSVNTAKILGRIDICDKRKVAVSASSGNDGTGSLDLPSESSGDANPVESLPLESKLKERLEQKLRMKLAKKIRLRRKRLVQKRQLRKKGRWPPSKMKKNKNI